MIVGKNTKIWHEEKSVILDCEIGDNCTLHAPIWIGQNVKIGNNCKIQAFCFIPEGVTLEDDVFLGPNCVFTNDLRPPRGKEDWSNTLIKKGASIGAGCVIVCGVTIGENSLVGAGTTVFKDVPDNVTIVNEKKMRVL